MTQRLPAAITSGVARAVALSFAELADAFVANYEGGDQSLAARVQWCVGQLGGDRPAAEITRDDLLDALEALARTLGRNGKPLSAATVNRHASTLGGIFRWADRRRLMPRGWVSPTRGLGRRPESQGRVRYLSDAERSRLLAACRVSKWRPLYAFVLLAITTGARKSELLGLTWARVDLEDATAYVPTSKNEDPRVLVLVPQVLEALRKVKPARATGELLVFPSPRKPWRAMEITKHWKAAISIARIDNFRLHDLRHTCASYLAQSGASLIEIAEQLGHRQLAVVRRYAHLSTKSRRALVGRVFEGIA